LSRSLSKTPPPRSLSEAHDLSHHLETASLSGSRVMQGNRERMQALIHATHEYAEPLIRCALDPTYPKSEPLKLPLDQLTEIDQEEATIEDRTRLPPEQRAVTHHDLAELEQLAEPVKAKLKALVHCA
jgi:hypothetical protein